MTFFMFAMILVKPADSMFGSSYLGDDLRHNDRDLYSLDDHDHQADGSEKLTATITANLIRKSKHKESDSDEDEHKHDYDEDHISHSHKHHHEDDSSSDDWNGHESKFGFHYCHHNSDQIFVNKIFLKVHFVNKIFLKVHAVLYLLES